MINVTGIVDVIRHSQTWAASGGDPFARRTCNGVGGMQADLYGEWYSIYGRYCHRLLTTTSNADIPPNRRLAAGVGTRR